MAASDCSPGFCGSVGRPWADGGIAELLRRHVRNRFRELPAMAEGVFEGEVALAVLAVDGRFEHDGPMVAGAGKCGIDIIYPDPNEMGVTARLWRVAFATDVCDDHGAVVANGHLGTMALADAGALGETEGGGQEGHRSTHVGVDEDRHDGRRWYRAIDLHGWTFPSIGGQCTSGGPISRHGSLPVGGERRGELRQRMEAGRHRLVRVFAHQRSSSRVSTAHQNGDGISSAEDDAWVADVPDLEFCSAFGDTPHGAVAEVEVAIEARSPPD